MLQVKSYNYGVPTNRRSRNTSHRTSFHHNSIFVSSPRHPTDPNSYGKPAEIYVYARKRPLLPAETNFQDTITVPDNKRIIITENKANLDSTPLLKKVFPNSDRSNNYISLSIRRNFNSIMFSVRTLRIKKYSSQQSFHSSLRIIVII